MSSAGWLAAGYALLMWAAGRGLRARAGSGGRTWVEAETVAFTRVIAFVPLAVGVAVALFGLWRTPTRWGGAVFVPLLGLLCAESVRAWRIHRDRALEGG